MTMALPAAAIATVEEVGEDLRAGYPVVVREGEDGPGYLVIAAEFAGADAVNFLARRGGGLICLALDSDRCDQLGLRLLESGSDRASGHPFTVSIESREEVTTGISAADRARTIAVAIDPARRAEDLVAPGHVFPLRAERGGVLARPTPTEAAVDLARIAGLRPAAAICEILDDEGVHAAGTALDELCSRLGTKAISIAALVAFRRGRERLVERIASSELETEAGRFLAHRYCDLLGGALDWALVRGDVRGGGEVLVRVERECVAGHAFGATDCDCAARLRSALRVVADADRGVLVYLGAGDSAARAAVASGQACSNAGGRADESPGHGRAAPILHDLGVSGASSRPPRAGLTVPR